MQLTALRTLDMAKQSGYKSVTTNQLGAGIVAGLTAAAGVCAVIVPWGDVAAAVILAVAALVAIGFKLWGNNFRYSIHCRRLLLDYQYYVLGDTSVRTDTDVDENLMLDCWHWFQAVYGVPIYDDIRCRILRQLESYDGHGLTNPGYSYSASATEFMACPEALAAGVTYERAYLAALIGDIFNLPSSARPASWQEFPVAQYWIDTIPESQFKDEMATDTDNNTTSNYTPGVTGKENPIINALSGGGKFLIIGIAVVGWSAYRFFRKKKLTH